MFDQFKCEFRLAGVVAEKRTLTSPKNATWRGFVCKVSTMGATFELGLDGNQFETLKEGDPIQVKGHIEDNQGRLRLIAEEIAPVKSKPAAA